MTNLDTHDPLSDIVRGALLEDAERAPLLPAQWFDADLVGVSPTDARRPGRLLPMGVAAALVLVATIVAIGGPRPGSDGSNHAVAWAATPDEVSATAADAVDTSCRAASGLSLPDASSIDLRGTVGAALYEMGDTWHICTFIRNGDDASFATITSVPAPQRPQDLPDDATGVMRVQTTDASIDGNPITVASGKCFDAPCPRAVTLMTDAGQGIAVVSLAGTFVVWAPAGSELSISMNLWP